MRQSAPYVLQLDYRTLTVSAGSTLEIKIHGISNETMITANDIRSETRTRLQLIFTGTKETK